ncbi:hypothetical protein SAMN05661044_04678 [Olivibacter domesticus]|uniref:Uncharacterized protein n=1 Tax=Olivibacter domesticus TaxID=407022 RepID=A0A1H7WUJ1_OLID1|nr:hypothetical protein SAMN05661044_04678 [Olivibacter domesticus]
MRLLKFRSTGRSHPNYKSVDELYPGVQKGGHTGIYYSTRQTNQYTVALHHLFVYFCVMEKTINQAEPCTGNVNTY